MRSIEKWAAETIAYLSTFQPRVRRVDAYDYDEQLEHIVVKLSNVRGSNLADVLSSLFSFARFWGVPLNKVMPTQEEVASWLRE